MTSETIDAFRNECESDLTTYTNQFNDQKNEFGFKVIFTVVDKNPIGLGYGLKMTYKELTLQQADVLLPSMNIPALKLLTILNTFLETSKSNIYGCNNTNF